MPAVSPKQQRFFGWLKANPAEAQRRGISPKVADEFAHKPPGGYGQMGARRRGYGARYPGEDVTPPKSLGQVNIPYGGLPDDEEKYQQWKAQQRGARIWGSWIR